MESTCLQEKKFYYNSLFYDYIFSYEKLKKYFHYDFHRPDSFKKRAEHVSDAYNNSFRAVVSDRLLHINRNFGCSEAAIKNCESLRDPHTMVVIGGQQPGLLTGPAFIIYKIFSIIKLSEHLADLLNLKVIPVFWNASDDSNFSQVNNTFLLDKELKKVVLDPADIGSVQDQSSSKRFSDIIIPKHLASKIVDEFLGFLPQTDFKAGMEVFFAECLDRLSEDGFYDAPTPGLDGRPKAALLPEGRKNGNDSVCENSFSLNDFFSAIITGLFSKYGLVIIDPSDFELKKLAMPIIEKDIFNHGNIEKLINNSGKTLAADGYHNQLSTDKDFLNFFIVKDGVRKRIKCGPDSSYIFENAALSEDELKSLIISDFSKISLNVVLRPLFQDTVLPVLATVCGPGEVSYFSQLKLVYDVFGIKQPVIYPRFSATIVENKIKKAIEKTGAGFELLSHELKDAVSVTLERSLGIDTAGALKVLEDDIVVKIGRTKNLMNDYGIDCTLYFDRLEDNLKKEIKILNKKISSDVENKNYLLTSGICKIYSNLFPEGLLQERVINIFYYINKYDFKLLDDLYDIIDIENRFHKLIMI